MIQLLPKDLMNQCIGYLSFKEIYNFINKNPLYQNYLDIEYYTELIVKINYIFKHIPQILIDLFTIQEFLDAPIIEWNDRFIGNTDYIDRIKPSDIKYPISIGVDPYGRAFICLKIINVTKQEEFVCTLFQRYSNQPSRWTYGCHSYANFIKECGYFLIDEEFRHKNFEYNIHQLLTKKKCQLRMINNQSQEFILGH